MFENGQVVLYANQGIFRVAGQETQSFAGTSNDYYVLDGVFETQRKVYVPVKNEKLIAKMNPVLSADEVNGLIDSIKDRKNIWIDDENRRKESFKEILSSGNRGSMLDLMATLYSHRIKCQDCGRKMHQCDERAFKEAEKLIYGEFSYVLGIDQSEISSYIAEKMPQVS